MFEVIAMERIGNTYLVSEKGVLTITTSRWDAMFREVIGKANAC